MIAALPVLFSIDLGQVVYPLVCVLAVFPGMVLAAAWAEPPGPRLTRVFETLGAASYPLYALHKPLGEIVTMALHQRAPQVMQHWAVLAGAPYLLAVLGVCILVERYYDRPARQALKTGLGRSWSLAGRTARAAFGPAIAAIAK